MPLSMPVKNRPKAISSAKLISIKFHKYVQSECKKTALDQQLRDQADLCNKLFRDRISSRVYLVLAAGENNQYFSGAY